jgi:hypothetical protein
MYRLTKFGIFLTAVALWCWPVPILAGPTVPYRDFVKGVSTTTGGNGTTIFYQSLAGTGVATQLGRFTMTGTETLTVTSVKNGVASGPVSDGTFTLTAADRSTVSGTFNGTFTINLTTGARKLLLSVQVKQGTGRLLGVTGQTTTTVISDAAGNFTYKSVGTLTFP